MNCVICAHRPNELSGVEFLSNLRAGRWGGLALQQLNFILLMSTRDKAATEMADRLNVTGYIVGSLGKENVRDAIVAALDPCGAAQTAPNFKIAHLRASEMDLIVAPFPASFGRLSTEKQRQALDAVGLGAQKHQLNGAVVAIYPADNCEAAFVAPAAYDRFLSRLTVESVQKMLNRSIHVEWIDGDPTVDATAIPDEPFKPRPLFDEDEEQELARITKQATDRRQTMPETEKPAHAV